MERYPRLLQTGIYLGRLGLRIWRKLVADDCLDRAGSLAYTTVLSLVPLLAVSFMVFRLSDAFEGVEAEVRTWVLEGLLAESVGSVSRVLDMFLSRVTAGAVGLTGVAVLVFTSIWLFITAEGTLNHIWRVARPRSLVSRVTTFWALVTLGPLLVGLGFYLSAAAGQTALGRLVESAPWLRTSLTVIMPYLVSVAVLTLVYKLVPNTRVRWRAALVGGLVAGILFELSKGGFNLYVIQIYQGSTSTRIYGAFALFPVFLLWIYIAWLVVLFGAVVAYAVQHLDLFEEEDRRLSAGDPEEGAALSPYLACRLLLLVACRHHQGEPPLGLDGLARAVRLDERTAYRALHRLERGGLVMTVKREGDSVWLPARDIGSITLADALEAYAAAGLGPDEEGHLPCAQALDDLFCDLLLQERAASEDITFADLAETVSPDELLALFARPGAPRALDEVKRPAPLPRQSAPRKRAEPLVESPSKSAKRSGKPAKAAEHEQANKPEPEPEPEPRKPGGS